MKINPARLQKQVAIKVMLLPLLGFFALANSSAPLNYVLDASASSVSAKVPFFGLSSKTAKFPRMNGNVTIVPDQPQAALVDVTFDAASIEAPDKVTLDRLRGEKFFWVEKYPTIRFVGNQLDMTSATKGKVKGKLTARGVTHDEVLSVTFDTAPQSAPAGEAVTLTGTMTIDRRKYGMKAYQLIVGNKVKINLRARMLPR